MPTTSRFQDEHSKQFTTQKNLQARAQKLFTAASQLASDERSSLQENLRPEHVEIGAIAWVCEKQP